MIRMSIDNAQPGMILAKHIYSADGKILLAAGVKLEDRYIARLKELGIPAVYIKDKYTEDIYPEEVISEETKVKALVTIKNLFQETIATSRPNLKAVHQNINNIVDEILYNRNALFNLAEVRAYDDYTYCHSVNVCVLAIVTGISLNYNREQLCDLGVGALLHDIGKTRIDPQILNKPAKLTPEEYEIMKTHASHGFNILRQNRDISTLVAQIAFQHHERLNGSGYPRGLQKDEIHAFARIVSVADVFDALTSDRVYRPGLPAHKALDHITNEAKQSFDSEIVARFIENIAPYPVATMVLLNTGQIGVIVKTQKGRQHRPIVRILFNSKLEKISQPYEIDLAKHEKIFIVRSISPAKPTFMNSVPSI